MSCLRFIYLFINYSCFDFFFLERIRELTVLNQFSACDVSGLLIFQLPGRSANRKLQEYNLRRH